MMDEKVSRGDSREFDDSSSTILDEVVFMYTLQYIKFMNFAKISIFNQI